MNKSRAIAIGDQWRESEPAESKPKFIKRGDQLNYCFGKYKGKDALSHPNTNYLRWCLKNVEGIEKAHKKIIRDHLNG